ncbi:hypothetical protein BDY17DRAFT_193748 [Neohortaea acidophila]|uniref:Uncharacterized protein n=1 Tax=Neohortaea acidophila TaxID=245834 RepID=A0A6A6PKE5_9PEZI|nr:uncharacterized protein BDY17DRAFT_193748 [Neohortaea acidophila]KAF2480489.1 hypothetical protein BDY17DRAFT_193748 [Neohortaea acidophila]
MRYFPPLITSVPAAARSPAPTSMRMARAGPTTIELLAFVVSISIPAWLLINKYISHQRRSCRMGAWLGFVAWNVFGCFLMATYSSEARRLRRERQFVMQEKR